MTLTNFNILAFAFTLTLLSSPLLALNSDKTQPLEIEADSFHLDDAKEVTVYSGNVIVTQGSIKILADKITIHGTRGTTNRVIAVGNPVKFKQQPNSEQALIRGEAKRLEYRVTTDTVVLTDNATLWQDGNTFSSNRIIYDSKRSIAKAGNKGSSSERVKITLKPAK